MSNIISIYLLTIIFFLKKKTTSILTAPNGLKWVTYTSSNEITVEGDSFIDVILYDFKYIYSDGTENILSDQTSSRQIYHVQVKMVKKYYYHIYIKQVIYQIIKFLFFVLLFLL